MPPDKRSWTRRELLLRMLASCAAGVGITRFGKIATEAKAGIPAAKDLRLSTPFTPVRAPIPLANDGLSALGQQRTYKRTTLRDELVVPDGYKSDVLLRWGDRLGSARFGFNNDYIAFTRLDDDLGLLTVNFEYISVISWMAGYASVMGQSLPFELLLKLLKERGGSIDAQTLSAADPLYAPLRAVAVAAMQDMGIGVAGIKQNVGRGWQHRAGPYDRRIHGITGLHQPGQRLHCSGPAAAVFRRQQRLGYNDGLADRVIGTFANCGGGQTPWGTVLSAEENIQTHVVEAVYADGSSPAPAQRPFHFDGQRLEGLGNPFGLAGNKYGWMVEIDPRQLDKPPIKHTALGRFRHEAVAVDAKIGQPLVVYSGCDRHGGHLYRYISSELLKDTHSPTNSRLLERGRLEVARFMPDGTGEWIPLQPLTAVNPLPPSLFGRNGLPNVVSLPHGDRSKPGGQQIKSDAELESYRHKFQCLGDLYLGNGEEQLGAILIDAHLAANAAGATPTARPEDTKIDPASGDLLISFTAGGTDGEGHADPTIFRGPGGESSWPYGWVMRLQDGTARPRQEGGTFRWSMEATGGAPWQGGKGFANPDNLAVDRSGNIWMVTDRATVSGSADVFGNNSCWLFPKTDTGTVGPVLFATGPMECELTGPCFDHDESTLFLSVQHPGEDNGIHREGDEEVQSNMLVDRDGSTFEQLRTVPLGSNWPSGTPGEAPLPAVVAIRRLDGAPLLMGTAAKATPERQQPTGSG